MGGGGPLGASPFAPAPDTPATADPPVGWSPAVDLGALTVVHPVPWARRIEGTDFDPERWGARVIRISALGGLQWLIRRPGAPELALWVPEGLAPRRGAAFGLYIHPDRDLVDRCHMLSQFRRAIGLGAPLRAGPFADARRHAVMLWLYDARAAGTSLQGCAAAMLGAVPPDWRSSSVRSDLRRLADAGDALVRGGYRTLLR